MASKIFINLPVKDLQRSIDFFGHLGYSFDPEFTDDSCTCMIISEHIFAMLITEKRFQDFTKKEISDATKSTEVLLALDAGSREEVDEMVRKAEAAGGIIYREPEDHGWMYGHSFADPDGHQWEIIFMDEAKRKEELQAAQNL